MKPAECGHLGREIKLQSIVKDQTLFNRQEGKVSQMKVVEEKGF